MNKTDMQNLNEAYDQIHEGGNNPNYRYHGAMRNSKGGFGGYSAAPKSKVPVSQDAMVNTSPQGPTSVHQAIKPSEYYETVKSLLADPTLGTFLYRAQKQLRKVKPEELNAAIRALVTSIEDKLTSKQDIGNEPSVGVDGV